MIKLIIHIANQLESLGLYKEAAAFDNILSTLKGVKLYREDLPKVKNLLVHLTKSKGSRLTLGEVKKYIPALFEGMASENEILMWVEDAYKRFKEIEEYAEEHRKLMTKEMEPKSYVTVRKIE